MPLVFQNMGWSSLVVLFLLVWRVLSDDWEAEVLSKRSFREHTTCQSCLDARPDFGWNPDKRLCGGWDNRKCTDDERDYAKDHPYILELKSKQQVKDMRFNLQELTDDNFEDIVLDTTKHVWVEFYVPWCRYCKELEPVWREVAGVFKDETEVVIAKMDGEMYTKTAQKYGVVGYPTLKWFPKDMKHGMDWASFRPNPESAQLSKKNLVDFVNGRVGTQRDLDGHLMPQVGRIKALDSIVALLEDDREVDFVALAKAIEQQAGPVYKGKLEEHFLKIYLQIVKGLQEHDFVVRYRDTIESQLLDDGPDAAQRKEMQTELNILKAFQGLRRMSVKELRAFSRANSIDTADAVEKEDFRRAIQRAIPTGADRLAKVADVIAAERAALAKAEAEAQAKARRKADQKRAEEERQKRRAMEKEAEKASPVVKLTDLNFNNTVSSAERTKHLFVHFYRTRTLLDVWEKVATELQGQADVTFARLDVEVAHKTAAQVGIPYTRSGPTLIWYAHDVADKELYVSGYHYDGPQTKKALVAFARNQGVDPVEDLPPEQVPDSDVRALGRSNWNDVVMDPTATVLVLFHVPQVGLVSQVEIECEKAATSLTAGGRSNVVVGKVDVTVQTSLAWRYKVKSTPTFIGFPQSRKQGERYGEQHKAAAMRKYLLDGGYRASDLEDLDAGPSYDKTDFILGDDETEEEDDLEDMEALAHEEL
mmetsp:Transcript_108492/g.187476  ORF Transcript_108492/g.187476 Transcript_108492/m.187476 type:complete len:706 (-) Transcript_108492:575-2692(-)